MPLRAELAGGAEEPHRIEALGAAPGVRMGALAVRSAEDELVVGH